MLWTFRGLIKSAIDLDAAVFSSSDLFVYTACYKKLIRFEKIASNLRALQRELKENYEKGGLRAKRLRKDSTTQEAVTDSIEQPSYMIKTFTSSSSTASKALKFPTTSTSSFGQEPVKDSDFSFNTCPPALFLTSTPVAVITTSTARASSVSIELYKLNTIFNQSARVLS